MTTSTDTAALATLRAMIATGELARDENGKTKGFTAAAASIGGSKARAQRLIAQALDSPTGDADDSAALLNALEARVDTAEHQAAEALLAISESGLWKTRIDVDSYYDDRYKSFDLYAESRFGLSKSHAYRKVAVAKVTRTMRDAGMEDLIPASERAIRSLYEVLTVDATPDDLAASVKLAESIATETGEKLRSEHFGTAAKAVKDGKADTFIASMQAFNDALDAVRRGKTPDMSDLEEWQASQVQNAITRKRHELEAAHKARIHQQMREAGIEPQESLTEMSERRNAEAEHRKAMERHANGNAMLPVQRLIDSLMNHDLTALELHKIEEYGALRADTGKLRAAAAVLLEVAEEIDAEREEARIAAEEAEAERQAAMATTTTPVTV